MDKGIEALIARAKRDAVNGEYDGQPDVCNLIAALEQAQHKAVRDSQRKIELEVDLVDANGRLLELHKRIAELEAAPNGMMQLSNELAEMLVEKLPSKSKLSLSASSHHRSYGDGFNVGIEKCAEAIRAAVGTVEGSE